MSFFALECILLSEYVIGIGTASVYDGHGAVLRCEGVADLV